MTAVFLSTTCIFFVSFLVHKFFVVIFYYPPTPQKIYIYIQKQCRQKFTCSGKYRQVYRVFEITADKNTGVHKKY